MSTAAASEERAARRAVERPAGSPTLGRFLLAQLYEAGVDAVFGVGNTPPPPE